MVRAAFSAARAAAQSAGNALTWYYGPMSGAPVRVVRRNVRVVRLETPPTPRLVPDGVFDDYGWCPSDVLEWRCPADRWDEASPIDGSDPARMVFVVRRGAGEFLPREPACVHAFGLGLTDEEALAPWGIDAATDGLHERRARPRDVLWLAADNLNALFWGLHDWAHFHNHGPFEQRAWTELQCDATALAWLWRNRVRIPLDDDGWERVRRAAAALSRDRFAAEGLSFDAHEHEHALAAQRVQGLAGLDWRTAQS